MKKFLFLVVAAFICSTMSAQQVRRIVSYKKSEPLTVWYLKGGLNLSTVDADGAKSKLGYNVGVAFDRHSTHSDWFWSSGLQLATKGFKAEAGYIDASYIAHKLEIPLMLGYKYEIDSDLIVDFRVGAFVNYDLFGEVESEGEIAKLSDIEDYDRFSAGVQGGIGLWYRELYLNITYQNGIVKQNEMQERNWMFSVGYAF